MSNDQLRNGDGTRRGTLGEKLRERARRGGYVQGGLGELVKIDNIDKEIIMAYMDNSRSSIREVAGKIGVSTATVLARTRRLEGMGIIRGYSILLDYDCLGFELTTVIELLVSKGKISEAGEKVSHIPNVCAVYNVTGATDLMIIAKFRNRKALADFIRDLSSIPSIEKTNTHVVLTTMKEDFRVPLIL
jgi:DNA-binding Lrp family transcriptional regulator